MEVTRKLSLVGPTPGLPLSSDTRHTVLEGIEGRV
ncbi:hypothetical protein JOE69_000544 [Arthrobacter russicus]|uniref:Uncharacterized protein n=1 Tax=Arthrobacter russicus TaxID=172040 RepID=A0ABU1J8V8_9MICC|nr:hypothetical protein [Arthrobacter russicus]